MRHGCKHPGYTRKRDRTLLTLSISQFGDSGETVPGREGVVRDL